ncbi:MAG: HAMP domain-containing histidine kinase [Gammaproteobacteria bacterium]|nr:HAMP domain-containing histidine kinase [Gammaproteobacteria bacterium]
MASSWLQSVALRLTLPYVGVLALAVGILLGSVFLLTGRELARASDQLIVGDLAALRADYDAGGLQRLLATLQRRSDHPGGSADVYLLIDAGGNRVAGNLPAWPDVVPDGADPWIEFHLAGNAGDAAGGRVLRARVATLDSHRLLVGRDVSQQRVFAARLRAALLWSMLLAALLAGLTGWWYSRRVAARVRATARACEQIMGGDLARRLPVGDAQDEFAQLAAAVNQVLDRLEQQSLAVHATFSSAAHDLRSPLQRLRMRLESVTQRSGGEELREALGAALGDLERVQRTLATLLQIAHAAAATPLSRAERIDLAELARELVQLYAPAAREAGLALNLRTAPCAGVAGSRQLLAQLLASLLENALRFVPAGGAVEVSVAAGGDGGAVLSVVDNGPGIPAELRATAIEPFRRLEPAGARAGSGLGLSLVAAVMRLHRGRLVLADRSPGLEVRCEFAPAAAAAGRAV